MKCLFVAFLLAVCQLHRSDASYSMTISTPTSVVGASVTTSWTGSCSHKDFTGCYDWIAAFQKGACPTGAVNADTCYLTNEWHWVSKLSSKLSYQFEAPGIYEFRIPYCGCKACNLLTSNFARCPNYENEGTSPSITVGLPYGFDLSKYSPGEQFALGIVWVEVEGAWSIISSILALKPSSSQPAGPSACSASCLCDLSQAAVYMGLAVRTMDAMYQQFSMDQLKTLLGYVSSALKAIVPGVKACGVDSMVGKGVAADITAAAGELLTGIGEVKLVFDLTLDGEKVFSDISNIIESWRLNNYFGAGVNTGRLINTVLSAAAELAPILLLGDESHPHHRGQPSLMTADYGSSCVIRRPGGQWNRCNCSAPRDAVHYPGNSCRTKAHYEAIHASRDVLSSDSGTNIGAIVGISVGAAVMALLALVVVIKRRRARVVAATNETSRDAELMPYSQLDDRDGISSEQL